jgi:hypothetical protein
MIYYGVLPLPSDDFYDIRWKSIMQMTPYEESRITAAISAAIVSVAQAPNVITPQEFRNKYLNLPIEPEEGFGELKETQGADGAPITSGGYISSGTSGRTPGPDATRTESQSNVDDTVVRASIEALIRSVGSEYESELA